MKVVEKKVSDLVPYENNPRNNEKAVEGVAASIQKFGFRVPLVVDKENVVVAGHTRLLAAQKLGLKKVPCVVAEDLTDEQIKAYRLADNKVAEASSWDWPKLEQELTELEALDIDMSEFGFEIPDDVDMDDFFESHESESAPKIKTKKVTCPKCGEEFEIEV